MPLDFLPLFQSCCKTPTFFISSSTIPHHISLEYPRLISSASVILTYQNLSALSGIAPLSVSSSLFSSVRPGCHQCIAAWHLQTKLYICFKHTSNFPPHLFNCLTVDHYSGSLWSKSSYLLSTLALQKYYKAFCLSSLTEANAKGCKTAMWCLW